MTALAPNKTAGNKNAGIIKREKVISSIKKTVKLDSDGKGEKRQSRQ